MSFDIRKAVANSIEKTGDPLAAIKLQEAHKYAGSVGQMLTSMGDLAEANALSMRLLKDFTDAELDKANPNFVIALCGCLSEALLNLGRSFAEDPSMN